MDVGLQAKYQARAQVLKALAHPSRLLIVDQLAAREHSVAELTALVGADISTVSKHLSILKTAGLVNDQRRGKQVFYSLRTPCVLSFFGCVETVLQAKLDDQLVLMGSFLGCQLLD